MTYKEALEGMKTEYPTGKEVAYFMDTKTYNYDREALFTEPCDDAISRAEAIKAMDALEQADIETFGCSIQECFDGKRAIKTLQSLPPVKPQELCEDIAKAFQIGLAFGFGEKHNEMDRVIDEIKKVITPQTKTGHLIQTNEFFINQDGQFIYKFMCSECQSLLYFRKSHKKVIGANVCPNCCAQMKKL